ncbi:hypothetical protein HK57_00430 [Aspergillus ustus]|uniref:Carboxylic ester hydrolase n=1 Tax=Aspergillus ustus TaxID=40382 RepID=A0A0C1BW96_ASPUT|nr:hypothetical protein HK57_00430 [Aspergillus ustus]
MGSTTAPKEFTFEHAKLGELKGWHRQGDIVQFRGIPFASIPGRFRQSVLRHALPTQPFDATQPGPVCPTSPPPTLNFWDGPLTEEYPVLKQPVEDEFECLNLSITAPLAALENTELNLPVFTFIHGGGFVGGNQSIQVAGREMFDMHNLVQRSVRTHKPIIAVTINYRVGLLGFLASRSLAEFNKSHGEPVGNYGLHDQSRAIEWLSYFINGFGGDPSRITIQGTSAGSASCHYQSFFPRRQFSRVILASGGLTSIGPLSLDKLQQLYDRVVAALDTEDSQSGTSSLDNVRHCPVQHLTHRHEFDLLNPLVDGEYILDNTILAASRGEEVLPIMMGATAFEDDLATFLFTDLKSMTLKSDGQILSKIKEVLSANGMLRDPTNFPFNQPAVLESYGLTSTVSCPSQNVEGWSRFVAHCIFNIPNVHSALVTQRALPKPEGRVWLYHYDVGNLYPGCHVPKRPHHGANDPVLFNVAPDLILEEERPSWEASVLQTQDAWIAFINEESPWDPLRHESSLSKSESAGPVFCFRDHGKGRQHNTLQDGLGDLTARQYVSVIAESCEYHRSG